MKWRKPPRATKHRFTSHAYHRVVERCSTNFRYILELINQEGYIPLGKEPGKNREHDLIYLNRDEQWFVAVRDTKTLEVITFLPFDYHNAWTISEELLEDAKDANWNKHQSVVDQVQKDFMEHRKKKEESLENA